MPRGSSGSVTPLATRRARGDSHAGWSTSTATLHPALGQVETVRRRRDLISASGVTVLRGPRWSDASRIAKEWAAGQRAEGRAVINGHTWEPARPFDCAILDLTTLSPGYDARRTADLLASIENDPLRSGVVLTHSVHGAFGDVLAKVVAPLEIGPTALRLTDDEVGEVVQAVAPNLAEPHRDWIVEFSDGWLQLAAVAAEMVAAHPTASKSECERVFQRRLLGSMTDLSDEQQAVLACHHQWDAGMLSMATPGMSDCEATCFLADLEALGVLWRGSHDHDRFTVLGPLARALRSDLPQTVRSTVSQMQANLVEGLIEGGQLTDATEIALSMDAPGPIWAATERARSTGRWDLIFQVSEQVRDRPPEWFASFAELRVVTMLMNPGGEPPADAGARDIRMAPKSTPDLARDPLRYYLLTIGLYRVCGRLDRSVEHARLALKWASERAAAPELLGSQAMAMESAATTFQMAGDVVSAGRAMTLAAAAASRLPEQSASTAIAVRQAWADALRGDVRSSALVQPEDTDALPAVLEAARAMSQATVAYEAGSFQEARALAASAAAKVAQTGDWWMPVLLEAVFPAHSGDTAGARLLVQTAVRRRSNERTVAGEIHFTCLQMCVEMLCGSASTVIQIGVGPKSENEHAQVLLSAACLQLRHDRRALRLARRMVHSPAPRVAALAALVTSASATRCGETQLARSSALLGYGVVEENGLPSAVRYLTAESQRQVAELLPAQQKSAFVTWCQVHGAAIGTDAEMVSLAPRERQILSLLDGGLSMVQIAEELGISSNTAKTLARRLYRKLDVNSRAQAVEVGRRFRAV